MSEKNVENLMGITMDKVKQMVDTDAVVGKPITAPDGTMVIPISKLSYGFGSGGSDFPTKTQGNNELFGGGGGAGVTVTPVGFLVISSDGNVKMMRLEPFNTSIDRLIDLAPDFIDKITSRFKNKSEKPKEDSSSTVKNNKKQNINIDVDYSDEVAPYEN